MIKGGKNCRVQRKQCYKKKEQKVQTLEIEISLKCLRKQNF